MTERDAFMLMLNKTDEKLNEKDESIPKAATKDNDTSEEKTQA